MVFALYALAAAMVAGGLWSVIQGFEYVVIERGWTMAIAGSVVATGGVLLFGIARAVAALHRIEAALGRGVDRLARGALPDAPPPRPNMANLGSILSEPPAPPPVEPAPARAPADAASPAGIAAAGMAATGLATSGIAASGLGGSEPAAAMPALREPEAPPPDPQFPPDPRPSPDPLLADAPTPRPAPTASEPETRDEFGFAGVLQGTQDPEPPPEETPEAASRFGVHFDEPVVAEPEPAAPREDSEDAAVDLRGGLPAEDAPSDEAPGDASDEDLTVIGSYNSGGNTYVMFSNGSIQADTPNGRYRFGSLEELKEFIAREGEGGAA